MKSIKRPAVKQDQKDQSQQHQQHQQQRTRQQHAPKQTRNSGAVLDQEHAELRMTD